MFTLGLQQEEDNFDNFKIFIDTKDVEEFNHELPTITYLGGYYFYVSLKKQKYKICKEKLVEELII